jgi:hypothetical protein
LISLIETSFAEHGVAKVIPETDALAAAWRRAMAHGEIAKAVDAANETAKRWRDEPAPDELEDQVRALLEDEPEIAWDEALRRITLDDAP